MENTKRRNRTALGLFTALSFALLWLIIGNVRGLLLVTAEWNLVSVLLTALEALMILGALVIALITLSSLRADETPFHSKNVKRLRAMAILLVIYEPYSFLKQLVMKNLYPIVLPDGSSISVTPTTGGVILAAGLLIYCVSFVFQHGISLQQQFDETL